MDTKFWIEVLLAATAPIGVVGVIIQRIKSGRGIGARIIQFTGLLLIVPIVAVLAMEKILEGATVGTLIGGLTGYLLSGISNYDGKQGATDA